MNRTLRSFALRSLGVCLIVAAGCGDKDPAVGGAGGSPAAGGRGGSGAGGSGAGGSAPGSGGASGTGGSSAVDGGGGDSAPASSSYFPFAEGNTWTYEVKEIGVPAYQKVHQIVRPQLVEGTGPHKAVMAFRVETRKSGGVGAVDATISWQLRDGNRVVRYREVSCTAGSVMMANGSVSSCVIDVEDYWNPPRVRLDERPMNSEPAMGFSWPETYTEYKNRYSYGVDPNNPTIMSSMTMQTDTWRVTQVGATVMTSAGMFTPCIVLQKTALSEAAKSYTFCRGVGKVKEEGANQTETLVSYTVK